MRHHLPPPSPVLPNQIISHLPPHLRTDPSVNPAMTNLPAMQPLRQNPGTEKLDDASSSILHLGLCSSQLFILSIMRSTPAISPHVSIIWRNCLLAEIQNTYMQPEQKRGLRLNNDTHSSGFTRLVNVIQAQRILWRKLVIVYCVLVLDI